MKKILVGIDGSVRENDVIDAAIAVAKPLDARLYLVRALGLPTHLPLEALSLSPDEVERVLLDRVRQDVESQLLRVPVRLRGGAHALAGAPWVVIERAAADLDVDLIVIGSHGYGAIERVLGTTAAKVVNHADRSVLVVRAAERLVVGRAEG